MKQVYQILIALLILSSCQKEEDYSYDSDYDPYWKVENDYYFKGYLKDTSNNVGLANYLLNYQTCTNKVRKDTIIDSTYFYHFRTVGSKFPCMPVPTIMLYTPGDSQILTYYISDSLKILDDTVIVNIFF